VSKSAKFNLFSGGVNVITKATIKEKKYNDNDEIFWLTGTVYA
jgi:hypothetical protein